MIQIIQSLRILDRYKVSLYSIPTIYSTRNTPIASDGRTSNSRTMEISKSLYKIKLRSKFIPYESFIDGFLKESKYSLESKELPNLKSNITSEMSSINQGSLFIASSKTPSNCSMLDASSKNNESSFSSRRFIQVDKKKTFKSFAKY